MQDAIPFDWHKLLESTGGRIGLLVVAVLVVLGVLGVVWKWFRKSRRVDTLDPVLAIRLESPPEQKPAFPIYVRNLSSRLVAVIVAPLGVSTEAPVVEKVPGLVDRFIPGLAQAIAEHQPVVKVWPQQLSHLGFGHALLRNIRIPVERWRGSRWSVVSGPGFLDDRRYVVGLVMVSDRPNNMDLIRVEEDGEWPAVVHVDIQGGR